MDEYSSNFFSILRIDKYKPNNYSAVHISLNIRLFARVCLEKGTWFVHFLFSPDVDP